MKPLPEEIEIEKIFKIIRELYPVMKFPELYEITFEDTFKKMGSCSTTGQIVFSLSCQHGDLNCQNEEFVDTVVHELVHLNQLNMDHSEEFHTLNNLIRNKVLQKLREKRG